MFDGAPSRPRKWVMALFGALCLYVGLIIDDAMTRAALIAVAFLCALAFLEPEKP